MDPHALDVLEFDKIRQMLKGLAASELGTELGLALQPTSDAETVRRWQRETTEARRVYDEGQSFPLEGLRDIRMAMAKVELVGAILEPLELLKVASSLAAVRRTKSFLTGLGRDFEILRNRGELLAAMPHIERAIETAVDEHGEIRDSASRELADIRRSLRTERAELLSRLERLVRSGNLSECVQGDYVTFREGRYVIPVQSKYRSRVKGIIHGRSDTGTTVFVEPLDAIAQGNRLRELESEERMEIRRILLEIASRIRPDAGPIITNLEIMARLDLIWAKARLSAQYHMSSPAIVPNGALQLRRARHPLLLASNRGDTKKVVPLDINVNAETRAIVITGPNTGGKTVALKTIGLVCLMAQAGMHVPADPETQLPLLSGVYSDIGDEQSIEQNLSTFSSHLSNIVHILDNAVPDSLVLLDELGAGTDPLEGGALGQAILEALLERGALTFVTTHLNDLKVFAHVTDHVENAAMEFDDATLAPTFRLIVGAPGTSNALAIARRLGMSERVLARARQAIKPEADNAVSVLRRLADDAARARELRDEAIAEKNHAESLAREMERRLAAVDRERKEEVRRARDEARGYLRELEKRTQKWVGEMERAERAWKLLLEESRERGTVPESSPVREAVGRLPNQIREATRRMEHDVRESLPTLEDLPLQPVNAESLAVGMTVKAVGFGTPGRIVQIDDDRRNVVLQIRNAEVRLPVTRLEGAVTPASAPKATVATYVSPESSEEVRAEIDIHGLHVEEAMAAVDKYLDDAYLAGMETVTIIHGIGTGALKKMVQEVLNASRIVKGFREGTYHEGGMGVTVAKLAH